MRIVCNCLVKNEENFIWFAINSVIDYVDEILVWDTGSTDKTVEIIKSIKSEKIKFKEIGKVDAKGVSEARQRMLDETKSDWIFILDGDEIWYKDAIENIRSTISKSEFDVVVSPTYMLIGDIYHYQEERAGKYRIGERTGHYNIRAVRNLNGIHIDGIYPNEAYADARDIKVQDFDRNRIYFLENKYLHASHLRRSSKDIKKMKYELGEEFSSDFYYPEVLFKESPELASNPWMKMNFNYKLRALLETPLKKVKRRL